MSDTMVNLAREYETELRECRRDLHKYAEAAWTEFRTAAKVADTLSSLGFTVLTGAEVVEPSAMMGVPAAAELEKQAARAIAQGANPVWVEKMQGGLTGVMGVMQCAKPGPTVVFRFDLDANDAEEATLATHRPHREGFASVNKGVMHACGHDGHVAVGLALAKIIAAHQDQWGGTVKMLFQPAEEGVRGARAMVEKGLVDDADYLLGMHFGFKMKKTGTLACNVIGFLATSKLDAAFTGVPAHAGAAPETGRNALLAAAAAALNLHAISRHGQGTSRINVGVLQAGTGRNVIPANAVLKLETRGGTSAINHYMYEQAVRIIEAAAAMYDVTVAITETGGAAGGSNSPELVGVIEEVARQTGLFDELAGVCDFGASEDCSYFMERVQQRGGQAAYVMVGADLAAGHHDFCFDFDEAALVKALGLAASMAERLLKA